jgi:DnaJ like chaperone protein
VRMAEARTRRLNEAWEKFRAMHDAPPPNAA